MHSITVITPTTGNPYLALAVKSVAAQTYTDIRHLVVVDGKERLAAAKKVLDEVGFSGEICVLPHATGAGNFYGHRVYGAFPMITNADFVAFLDEDNWYEKNHIASLIEVIEASSLDWAYSLRSLVSPGGCFIDQDNCQSLGWWAAFDGAYHHIDTSCYLLRRSIAIESANIWNRPGYTEGVRDPDRELCRWLLFHYPRGYTNGLYTMNYRIGTSRSAIRNQAYYEYGNKVNKFVFNAYPWVAAAINNSAEERRHLLFKPKFEQIAKLVGPPPDLRTDVDQPLS